MKFKIFTVFDVKADVYMQPFFMQTNGQAMRSFGDAVRSPDHVFGKHPEDYTLFAIGEYDDSTAGIVMFEVKQPLMTALEAVAKVN